MFEKIFEKLKIKNYLDLNNEEKKTFEEWQKVLNKNEISIKELKEFITSQIDIVTNQLLTYKNSSQKDLYLKMMLRNYRMILAFIQSPQKAKEYLEKYITTNFK